MNLDYQVYSPLFCQSHETESSLLVEKKTIKPIAAGGQGTLSLSSLETRYHDNLLGVSPSWGREICGSGDILQVCSRLIYFHFPLFTNCLTSTDIYGIYGGDEYAM